MTRPRTGLMQKAEAIAAVREVYAQLEKRPVERFCERRTECCKFKLTGESPYLTLGEALVMVEELRKEGRGKVQEKADGSCPVLDESTGLCRHYDARPLGCRTHFCKAAGGPYSRREVVDLIRRLEDIDLALGGDGSRALLAALKVAQEARIGSGKVHSLAMPRARGRG